MSKITKLISGLEELKTHFAALSAEPCFFRCRHAPLIRVPPEWTIERRRIDDYHLLFVCGGRGTYFIDDDELEMRRGLTLFVGGTSTYRAEQDRSDPPQIVPVRFNAFRRDGEEALKTPDRKLHYAFYTPNPEVLEHRFLELVRLQQLDPSPLKRESIDALVRHILFHGLAELEQLTAVSPEIDRKLEKIRAWMTKHPLDRSEVASLARQSGISAKYFTLLFRKTYGMTPKHFQVVQRMQYASYMLRHSGCSIKELAQQLGYPDPYLFSKQFKAVLGVSPGRAARSEAEPLT